MTVAREEIAPRLSRVQRRGPYFFMLMTDDLSVGMRIGMIFHLSGGTPEKYYHGTCFLGAPAATMGFLRRFSAGAGAADHSYVFLAAAALHPVAGQPSGDGKMILALTSAPNDGCCAWIPGETRRGSALRNRPAGPAAERR